MSRQTRCGRTPVTIAGNGNGNKQTDKHQARIDKKPSRSLANKKAGCPAVYLALRAKEGYYITVVVITTSTARGCSFGPAGFNGFVRGHKVHPSFFPRAWPLALLYFFCFGVFGSAREKRNRLCAT
ncbi:hypothetical protein PG990_005903 [Apiospora arundinis]|uniref:Uncharacterized protein n=1 Tax=Apiospora arundinis TaxID=335852 RepID=A0ABR2J914_9PEZI